MEHVQNTKTGFGAFTNPLRALPLSLCRQYYKIVVISKSEYLSNPPPNFSSTWFVHFPLSLKARNDEKFQTKDRSSTGIWTKDS